MFDFTIILQSACPPFIVLTMWNEIISSTFQPDSKLAGGSKPVCNYAGKYMPEGRLAVVAKGMIFLVSRVDQTV